MKDLFNLDNRVAIVTGGLGQLGIQYSIILCDYGAKVAVLDIVGEKKKENDKFDNYLNSGNIKIYKAVSRIVNIE